MIGRCGPVSALFRAYTSWAKLWRGVVSRVGKAKALQRAEEEQKR